MVQYSRRKPRSRQGARNVTNAEIAVMENLANQGFSVSQIAKKVGRNKGTVSRKLSGREKHLTDKAKKGLLNTPAPLLWDQLKIDPRRRLEDFAAFRKHYFHRDTPEFQIEIADRITKAPPQSRMIFLWPPGHGKTTMISHDYVIWRMLRARALGQRFACLLVSKTEKMGKAFLRRIKQTLEFNNALSEDYGWFRPENPDIWTQAQLQVDGFDPEVQGKEPTFIAAGAGSQIYGWRVDLIICDDLIDDSASKDPEKNMELKEWFHAEVESRLESGAALAVVGTRWRSNDLYGLLSRMTYEDDQTPFYDVFLYPAHDESKCEGECTCRTPCEHHAAYPKGCQLWPDEPRCSYAALRRARISMGSARFNFVYNQVDTDDEENLIRREWVESCKNRDRVLWHIPAGSKLVGTIDPSPTNWAAIELWAYGSYEDDDEKRYLVAIKRGKMTVGDYIATIEEWTMKCRERGYEPIWYFEVNAAQRWLFQSLDYKLLKQRSGVQIREHSTGRNKADPDYGIQVLRPVYEAQLVDLPWGDEATREAMGWFITELITYPNGMTDDGVMAQWFFEWNVRSVKRQAMNPFPEDSRMPVFLKERQKMVSIR